MSDAVSEAIQERVRGLRVDHPATCWRPAPDWSHLCILDLGHHGPCGWDKPAPPVPSPFFPLGPIGDYDPCAGCSPYCDSTACPKRTIITYGTDASGGHLTQMPNLYSATPATPDPEGAQ